MDTESGVGRAMTQAEKAQMRKQNAECRDTARKWHKKLVRKHWG